MWYRGAAAAMKLLVILAFMIFGAAVFADGPAPDSRPVIALGTSLFRESKFSTDRGDLPASCSDCHLYDQDPQGIRAYADFFNRSWVSSRNEDPRRLGLRNAPTIFDVADMPRLHYDGEFDSLEALVRGTISGRPMGWLPGEESQAFDNARKVVLNEKARGSTESYRELFKRAFAVNLETTSRDETVNLIARSVAAFCRTLTTQKDSAYDSFMAANGLDRKPAPNESGIAYGTRLLAEIDARDAQRSLRFSPGFAKGELSGMRVFFKTGNCIACHAPPQFTDHSFRNIGISQREYDLFNGEGSFARLTIPDSKTARRPSAQFREIPAKGKPALVDLGFWNFVDLRTSTLRKPGETDDQLLQRMIATFKTPTLRNLAYTYPYFHDGSLSSLEDVLHEMMKLSRMAREGRVREGDPELAKISLKTEDISSLVAFLNSLNDQLRKE
jgi:cytochrome c peroxidase